MRCVAWIGLLGLAACGGSTSAMDAGTDSPVDTGTCAVTCPGTSVCTGGACACASGQTVCGTGCFDINTDPLNCGGCGRVCYSGEPCMNGKCGMCPSASCPCPPDKLACIANDPIVCTDWRSDPLSCGTACHKCAAGEGCYMSKCTSSCPAGMKVCGGTCCLEARCIPRTDGTTVCAP